jgi:uncharacterized protein
MAAFVLDIKDIDGEGLHKTFPVDPAWLREALADADLRVPSEAEAGALDVRAQRSGEDILVKARLRSSVVAACARCLNDVILDIDTELTQLLAPESKRPVLAEELELDEADLDQAYYSGEHIALDDAVREQVILEVPMQVLCEDPPGCESIAIPEGVRPPADFGRDEVDPRLAPLLNLKRKLDNNEE